MAEDVSRETAAEPTPEPAVHSVIARTVEVEPAAAAMLAGERIEVLRAFAADLAERGEPLGLIGPLEPARLWTRHLLNSAVLAPLVQAGGRVADIGTGGGMPGLVLAIVRPDARFLLIEPMERRCAWLTEQVERLGLENVEVKRGRAEEFHGAFEVDQVTARAVTALRRLVPLTAPLLREGGEMLFLKGTGVDAEIAAAEKVLRKHRIDDVAVEELGAGLLAETTRVFRGRKHVTA